MASLTPSSGMRFQTACEIRLEILKEATGGVHVVVIRTTTSVNENRHHVEVPAHSISGHEVGLLQAVASKHDCTLSLSAKGDQVVAIFRKIPRG